MHGAGSGGAGAGGGGYNGKKDPLEVRKKCRKAIFAQKRQLELMHCRKMLCNSTFKLILN